MGGLEELKVQYLSWDRGTRQGCLQTLKEEAGAEGGLPGGGSLLRETEIGRGVHTSTSSHAHAHTCCLSMEDFKVNVPHT